MKMDNENKGTPLHVQPGPDNSLVIVGYGSMPEEIAALKKELSAAESHIQYLRRLAEEKLLLQQRLSKTLGEMTQTILQQHYEIVLEEPSRDERTRELEVNERLCDIINAFFEEEERWKI